MRIFWPSVRVIVALVCLWPVAGIPILRVVAQDAALVPLPFLPRGGEVFLSPDGGRIAHVQGKRVCIYPVTGGTPLCADSPHPPDLTSLVWSPDSTRLAFNDDYLRDFGDNDIWVLDASTGAFTDLTDDSTTTPSREPGRTPGDFLPQWSADGTRLFFLRYTDILASDPMPATLCAISAAGGPVETRAMLPDASLLRTYVFAVSRDGSAVVYGAEGAEGGSVRLASGDGGSRRSLPLDGFSMLSTFSPNGLYLLTFDFRIYETFQFGKSSNHLFTVLGNGHADVDRDRPAQWAGWSPRSDALVYVVQGERSNLDRGVYVVPRPGERGVRVVAGPFSPPSFSSRGLTWAANDTTLVQDDRGTGGYALVRLGGTQP